MIELQENINQNPRAEYYMFVLFILKGKDRYAVCHSLKHTHPHTLACMQTCSPSRANGLICKHGNSHVIFLLNATLVCFSVHCFCRSFL